MRRLMSKIWRISTIRWILALGLLLGLLFGNYKLLSEAYGQGPPYYGRSTNMDKWSDPLAVLLVANGIGAALVCFIIRIGRKDAGSLTD